MTRGHGSPILAVAKAYFLMMLITRDTQALPRRTYEFPDTTFPLDNPSSTKNSEDTLPRESRSPYDQSRSGVTANASQKTRQDDVTKLIERAFENGELLDPVKWSDNHRHGSNKSVQRDTSRQDMIQDAYTKNSPAKSQQRGSEEYQGQRRLFRDQEGSPTTETMQSDGKIVFPTDDVMLNHGHKFTASPVPVCQGSTFCERASYYPEDLVNNAIQQNDSIKFLAGVDVVSDIVQRIDVTDDVPLCVSTEQVVYPKSAENKRKEWLFVVNQDNFKQGIRIETCTNENGDCSVIDGLAEGYRTTCKQKYIYRQLAAISNDGSIAPEMFRFPSSCCCHIKFTGNPLSRMGINLGEQRSLTTVSSRRRRK